MNSDDYACNFRLFGNPPDIPTSQVTLSNGLRTVFRVGKQTGELFALTPFKLRNPAIRFRTFLHLIGPLAIVCVRVSNEGETSELVDLAFGGTLTIDSESLVPCFRIPTGVQCASRSYQASFVSSGEPLVVDSDAVWFGQSTDLSDSFWLNTTALSFSGDSTAVAISWQNRSVKPGETIVVSNLVRWGLGSHKPALDLSATSVPAFVDGPEMIEVNGAVVDRDGDSVSVVVVVDGDYSTLKVLEVDLPSGSVFKSRFRLNDFGVRLGVRNTSLYGIDSTEMISDGVSFATDCQWTVARATETAAVSPPASPTPSFTEGPRERRTMFLLESVLFTYFGSSEENPP
jgi:hypothetical protein